MLGVDSRGTLSNAIMDPLKFVELIWPDVRLYDKQAQIMYSFRDNQETFVHAGNGLGKDYIAALCALWFFCSRRPARIVTTSVKSDQLDDVLWGEIRNFIDTAKYKLPIHYNHMKIRQVRGDGTFVPKAELVGQVVNKGEALLGRHLDRGPNGEPTTAVIFDEASGMEAKTIESADTWAHCKLAIGNPYDCVRFKEICKAGDQKAEYGRNGGLRVKVINIAATDSPNVQYGFAQLRRGEVPDDRIIVPGLVSYATYRQRREVWDPIRQSIGLDGQFYEGAEIRLLPNEWMVAAEDRFLTATGRPVGKGMGVDTAQGGDNTCWCVVGDKGLLDLVSMKTPNTALIPRKTIALMQKWGIKPSDVIFDAGGGGKEHADVLREKGYKVRTIAFGGSASTVNPFKRNKSRTERIDDTETAYVFKNRRAELYGLLRQTFDPSYSTGFYVDPDLWNRKRPDGGPSLKEQLAVFPLLYDEEGRMYLPPKNKKHKDDTQNCLTDMIGCSPDEGDAFALANFARLVKLTTGGVGILAT